MCRYKKTVQVKEFSVEGNNGGDYLTIAETDTEGIVRLEVGQCCVVIADTQMPVMLLTALFTALATEPEKAQSLIRQLWPGYGDTLAQLVQHLG